MVLATPGGLVSEPATLNLMLSHCYTVWVKASPEEHMARVMAQGDFRPMAGNNEAMADLKRILASREAFYSKADYVCSTSHHRSEEHTSELQSLMRISYDVFCLKKQNTHHIGLRSTKETTTTMASYYGVTYAR